GAPGRWHRSSMPCSWSWCSSCSRGCSCRRADAETWPGRGSHCTGAEGRRRTARGYRWSPIPSVAASSLSDRPPPRRSMESPSTSAATSAASAMAAVGSPRWSARGPRPRARRGDVDGVAAPKEETQEGIGKKRRGSSWRRRLRRDGARRKTSISILSHLGIALFFLTHLVALLMIPLGLPGTFLQVGAALVMTVASGGARMGWGWVGLFFGLALVGELIEFLCGQWGTR